MKVYTVYDYEIEEVVGVYKSIKDIFDGTIKSLKEMDDITYIEFSPTLEEVEKASSGYFVPEIKVMYDTEDGCGDRVLHIDVCNFDV